MSGTRATPSGVITLLTDFGLEDPYVGIVKGVILGINPAARLVDLTHRVPPHDVLRGALALDTAYRVFPRGTVHLAVVDPGVGSPRRPLLVEAHGHVFVGPDNGLFGFLLDAADAVAVALENRAYHRTPTSRTFHGRDIFAPVAAHRSLGVSPRRFGPVVGDPVRLAWARPQRRGHQVVGQVLLADRFGNLLTNVTVADLPGPPDACVVEIGATRIEGVVGTYAERPGGALGAVLESSGRLEIFVREGSAVKRLGVAPGAPVTLWARAPSAGVPARSRSSTPPAPPTRPRRRPTSTPPGSRRPRRPSSPPPSPSSATRTGSR